MTRAEFLSRLATRGGLQSPTEGERIARVVLSTLAERLGRFEAERLASELPEGLDASVRAAPHGREFDVDELYRRVANRLGVRASVAVEHTVSVLRTTAAAVSDAALGRVREELPPGIAALLVAPEPPAPPPKVHLRPDATTLAEGHGGGARPLYAASSDRAHTHSVARNDDPHGDTKLSSARGLSQEREHETLAEGRPGSSRPLSGSR